MQKKLNDVEETSLNESLYYHKNLDSELKDICPENMNYNNNDYYKDTDIRDIDPMIFPGSNFSEEDQEQTENFQSSSKSLSRVYAIDKNNINNSIKKEDEKSLNKKRKIEIKFITEKTRNKNRKKFIIKNNNDHLIKKEEQKLLNKKRKREKQFNIENRKNFINKNNNNDLNKKEEEKLLHEKREKEKEKVIEKIFDIKKIKKIKKIKQKKYKQGRRRKLDNDIREHNCSSEDNIINKIKTHFFHYIRDIISKNSNNKKEKVKIIKFQKEFVSNLKKNINIELLETKLVDILKNQEISTKNKNSKKDQNKIIIEKIYEEKKEERIIKILELKFKELFVIFRRKLNKKKDKEELKKIAKKIEGLDLITNDNYEDTEYLIKDIEKQNSKNNRMDETELEEYKEKVKECCKNYEKWFYDKIERTKKVK